MKSAMNTLRMLAVSWAVLAVTVSGLPGLVLCISPDGHFALEMAHQGHCHDAADVSGHEHQAAAEVLSGVDAGCCDCVDVSLPSDSMLQPVSEVRHGFWTEIDLGNVLAAPSVDAVVDTAIGPGSPRGPARTPLRASPALLAQRTIVLRI